MDITVKVEAPELAQAINALAVALSSGASLANIVAPAEPTPASGNEAPTSIDDHGAPMAAVPTTEPAPNPVTAAVPTTTPTYTMDQLAVAGTQLMDAGRQADLIALLNSFGVPALTALPPEQYGNFATQLRALGAKI